VALIAVTTPERLALEVRAAIEQGPAWLSVVAYWEVMLKSMKGTLDVGNPRWWWNETLETLSLQSMVCRPEHVAALHELPPVHQDPFDRMLIAQAIWENLTLLTTDAMVPLYASDRLRVIR